MRHEVSLGWVWAAWVECCFLG